MKLVINIESEKEQEELKNFLKGFSGKISVGSERKPVESLIAFADKNAVSVKKTQIPARSERNER